MGGGLSGKQEEEDVVGRLEEDGSSRGI